MHPIDIEVVNLLFCFQHEKTKKNKKKERLYVQLLLGRDLHVKLQSHFLIILFEWATLFGKKRAYIIFCICVLIIPGSTRYLSHSFLVKYMGVNKFFT